MIDDEESGSGASGGGGGARRPAILFAAAVSGVIFGQYAQDVGQWVVCGHHAWVNRGDPDAAACAKKAIEGALLIGTFLSVVATIMGAAAAAHLGRQDPTEAVRTMVAALLGAFLAICKTAAEEKGYPDPSRLGKATLIYVGCILVLLPPFLAARSGKDAMRLVAPIAIAMLTGVLLGWLLQGVAELFWIGKHDRFSSGKFIVAPSATVTGGAAFGMALLMIRPEERRGTWQWTLSIVLGGVLLATAWAGINYYGEHGNAGGWLAKAGAGRLQTVLLCLGLLLPGVIAAGLARATSPADYPILRFFLFATPAMFVAAVAAWWGGQLLLRGTPTDPHNMPTLIAVHSTAVLLVPAAVLLSLFLHQFLLRSFGYSGLESTRSEIS